MSDVPYQTARSWIPRVVVPLVAAIVAIVVAGCDDPHRQPTAPSATASSTTTVTARRTVPLSSIDFPEGCTPFPRGYGDPTVEAGRPARIALEPGGCAKEALAGVSALAVEWTPLGRAEPVLRGMLRAAAGSGRWTTTVTFPEPGTWRGDARLDGSAFVEVFAADLGLVQPSPDLPLPGAPQTIAVLDGAATELRRTFSAELGGVGLLRHPDRAVFVQAREGGRWLVAADIATGTVTSLFEVGPFTNVDSAPDGHAVAVEWGTPNGRRQLRIVTASGAVTPIDDGAISNIGVRWAPDSSRLIATGAALWVLDTSGQVLARSPLDVRDQPSVFWSPDTRFALIRYRGSDPRLTRLDAATLEEDELVRGAAAEFAELAIAPDGRRVAIASQADDGAVEVSLVPLDALAGARLEDSVLTTVRPVPGIDFGRLRWSPDVRSIAFVSEGSSTPGDMASSVRVIDVTTGAVRTVGQAPDYYAGQSQFLEWSADSSTLYALRYNCSACEPSSSEVDVIDVGAGRVVRTFADASLRGWTADGTAALVDTVGGLVRTDGRHTSTPLIASTGGISFGPQATTLGADSGEPLLATALGFGRGQQIVATTADGATVNALAMFDLEQSPAALIDESAVVVRGDRRWERRNLVDGTTEPYVASDGAIEKVDVVLSPSGRLALDLDRDGFAVLDTTAPAAPAVVARRPYPGRATASPAWSRDERRVAFGSEHRLGVFDLDMGADHVFELGALDFGLEPDEPADRLWSLAWAPDGTLRFATASALWELDVDAGTARQVADAPPGGFTQGTVLIYAPDGGALAAGTLFGVFAYRAGAWSQLISVGLPVIGGALYWSPNGSALVFGGESAHVPQGIIVAPIDGSGAYRLVAAGAARVLGWLPDGRIAWVSVTGGV